MENLRSAVDECWALAGRCARWAEETKDKDLRQAFFAMAKAWARLAFAEVEKKGG